MAKIVLAGRADCPYYAKNEILADSLVKNLPNFNLHKIVKPPQDWEKWLADTCTERGWNHTKSPLIWRELVDRGGKGVLIGSSNEFQEYCSSYYGIRSDYLSDHMKNIAEENMTTQILVDEEEIKLLAQSKPQKVTITNASSPVCYNIINDLVKGEVFGMDVELTLCLLDSYVNAEYMEGLKMECEDLAYPLLRKVIWTTNIEEAFTKSIAIIFLDDIPQEEGEDSDQWLERNNEVFARYGVILEAVCKPDIKVIVAGSGPINFNATMLIKNTPSIPNKNIVALARVVEGQAKAIIAQRLNVNSNGVTDTIIWGNANGRVNGANIADVTCTRVHFYEGAITGPPSYSVPAVEMVHDDKWLATEFVELLQKRMTEVEAALGRGGTMTQAAAIVSTLRDWCSPNPPKQICSLGVYSSGHYGIPVGIVYSSPVRFTGNGNWEFIEDLQVDNAQSDRMFTIAMELLHEKQVIYPNPNKPSVHIIEDLLRSNMQLKSPEPEPDSIKEEKEESEGKREKEKESSGGKNEEEKTDSKTSDPASEEENN